MPADVRKRKWFEDHTQMDNGFDEPATKMMKHRHQYYPLPSIPEGLPLQNAPIEPLWVGLPLPEIIVTPPPTEQENTGLAVLSSEILKNLFIWLPPKDLIICFAVCRRFNSAIRKFQRVLQKRILHKLYIERLTEDSFLIKIQTKKSSDICLFEFEIDGMNICIETPDGKQNSLFDPSYQGRFDKVIKIFEDNPLIILKRCLEPILKCVTFEVIELDDVFAHTMFQLTELMYSTGCYTEKLIYKRRSIWNTEDTANLEIYRPLPLEMLVLISATRCKLFHSYNYSPGPEFWDSDVLRKISLVDEGEIPLAIPLTEDHVLAIKAKNIEINWNNSISSSGVRKMILEWANSLREIVYFVLKLAEEDQLLDILEFLGEQESFDPDKSFAIFERNGHSGANIEKLKVQIDFTEDYTTGALIIKRMNKETD